MADASRHARIKELYLACSELTPEECEVRLQSVRREAPEMADEVVAMLEFDGRRPEFLAAGPVPPGGLEGKSAEDEPFPERIGPYRIRQRLGKGGMGTVFEAEQESPHRTIALKLLHPGLSSKRMLQRFEQEGEILARLEHPGIARIYAAGHFDTDFGRQPYLAMERIQGQPLTRWAREARAGTEVVIRMIARVCDAVEHAHVQGVVHRDLKPANILVDAEGHPHVLDFGIARLADSDLTPSMQTREGEIVGTMAYMSPEQASGDPAAVDARMDVYSIGVLLYELLVGELPYDVAQMDLAQAIVTIREAEPSRLSLPGALRGDLETIVLKALEKEKERRYASAAALARDLRHYLRHEPIEARPASGIYHLRKFVRRHRVLVGATAAVILALSTGLGVALHFGFEEAQQRSLATQRAKEASGQAYRSSMLATHLSLDTGDYPSAVAQLEQTPEEQRGWEYAAMQRRIERKLAEVTIQDAWLVEYLDEERVLVIGEAGGGTIWNAVTGEREAVAVPTGIAPLHLSRDGKRLLHHAEGQLVVSDPLSGEVMDTMSFAHAPLSSWRAAAVSHEGRYVAVTAEGHGVYLFDRNEPQNDGALVYQPEEHVGVTFRVTFSSDGSTLGISRQGDFRLVRSATGEVLWSIGSSTSKFDALVHDARHNQWVTSAKQRIVFLDEANGTASDVWSGDDLGTTSIGAAFDLDLHPSGTQLVSIFQKRAPSFLLDRASGALVGWFEEMGSRLRSVRYSPSGRTLVTCVRTRSDRTVTLWSAETDAARVLLGHEKWIEGVEFTSDGKTLLACAGDKTARVWDYHSGLEQASYRLRGPVSCMALAPDDRTLVCGLNKKGSTLIDLETGVLQKHGQKAASLAFSPDGSVLAVGSPSDSMLVMADPATLEERWSGKVGGGAVVSVTWSRDGSRVASGTVKGNLVLWSYPDMERLAELQGSKAGAREHGGARSISFSPDGEQVVVGWGNSDVILYETDGLARPRVLSGHREEVFAVGFSPDGERIATGGRDGAVRVWDPENGGLLGAFKDQKSYIRCLSFTPDGRAIVTGSGDGKVRVWESASRAVTWRESFGASAGERIP